MPVAFVLGLLAVLWCDTPVYRYAMYRWPSSDYAIYAFSQGQDAQGEEQALRSAVEQAAGDAAHPANVEYVLLRPGAPDLWRSYPPALQQAWAARPDGVAAEQWRVVLSPRGDLIYQGPLASGEIADVLESEARRRLCEELSAARAGVLVVLLPGAPPEAGETPAPAAAAALEAAREAQQRVASGQAGLYLSPTEVRESAEGQPPVRETGLVTVYRDDPREQWLVRSLLAVQPDLGDSQYREQPMVFVAYGRARVLPPHLGAGVTADHLIQDIHFIAGACSCTVKDRNPGVDLLTRFDWDTAAELMADLFGTEEGNEPQMQVRDLFSQVIPPPPDGDGEAVRTSDPGPEAGDAAGAEAPTPEGQGVGESHAAAPATATAAEEMLHWNVWAIAGGLAVLMAVLTGAAFLLLQPR